MSNDLGSLTTFRCLFETANLSLIVHTELSITSCTLHTGGGAALNILYNDTAGKSFIVCIALNRKIILYPTSRRTIHLRYEDWGPTFIAFDLTESKYKHGVYDRTFETLGSPVNSSLEPNNSIKYCIKFNTTLD